MKHNTFDYKVCLCLQEYIYIYILLRDKVIQSDLCEKAKDSKKGNNTK